MRGVLALAWKLGVVLPREAERCLLEGLGLGWLVRCRGGGGGGQGGGGGGIGGGGEGARDGVGVGGRDGVSGRDGVGVGAEGMGEVPVDFDLVVVLPWEVGRRVVGEAVCLTGEGEGVVRVDLAGVVGEWAAMMKGVGGGR